MGVRKHPLKYYGKLFALMLQDGNMVVLCPIFFEASTAGMYPGTGYWRVRAVREATHIAYIKLL